MTENEITEITEVIDLPSSSTSSALKTVLAVGAVCAGGWAIRKSYRMLKKVWKDETPEISTIPASAQVIETTAK